MIRTLPTLCMHVRVRVRTCVHATTCRCPWSKQPDAPIESTVPTRRLLSPERRLDLARGQLYAPPPVLDRHRRQVRVGGHQAVERHKLDPFEKAKTLKPGDITRALYRYAHPQGLKPGAFQALGQVLDSTFTCTAPPPAAAPASLPRRSGTS
jgi:hypothetical protein